MKETLKQRLDFLKRTLPKIDPRHARYMYADDKDLKRRGKHVVIYVVIWSSDARVSLHKTGFSHTPALSVGAWAGELVERVPTVFRENVIPALNSQTGVSWAVDRVVGWHFVKERTR